MSGWWAWVAGPQGTTVLALCALVLGMILGYLTGHRAGWRAALADLRERREEAEANQLLEELRPLPSGRPTERTRVRVDYRPAPIPGLGTPIWARQQEEWEPAHVGQALALTAPAVDELTDSAYTQDMGARMDRFLNELFRVPYSADELWSGQ